ncbi:hypothetical protein C4569_00880 [Candidatus Parcubacteria bacterium]|nr:MAG: hypothetical protein C4569_00880 [Candidatus Parcubacteria bacterium]
MQNAVNFKKALNLINSSHKIILSFHKKPDGDALGAVCAMSYFLESQKKDYFIFCSDKILRQYTFLSFPKIFETDPARAKIFNPDLIILLDTGDSRYSCLPALDEFSCPKINIDHHISNELFGQVNIVMPELSSTAEIIYNFFRFAGHRIAKEEATGLLAGLIFDTGNFSNANTFFSTLQAASDLVRYGARLPQVNEFTVRNKSVSALQLWGKVLMRLSYNEKYKTAVTIITQEDIKKYKVDDEAVAGVANFLNNLSEVNATIVLKEEADGLIKGSMRTNRDDVDLSLLARIFGGGGHAKAAGFTISGRLSKTESGWKII